MAPTPSSPGLRRSQPALPHDLARRLVRQAAGGDRRARERLLAAYRPAIARVARGRSATLPASVDIDDLISCGMIGLDRAIDRYNGSAVEFEPYAMIRVRGAITDHLRELDWAPRSLRSDARHLRTLEHVFSARHGRLPRDEELAPLAELSPREVDRIRREEAGSQIVSLNAHAAGWGAAERSELLEAIEDESADDPCTVALRDCQATRMRVAIGRLGERDRVIFREVMLMGLPSTRVATIHGITEGRVSQILRRIREQLGRALVETPAA